MPRCIRATVCPVPPCAPCCLLPATEFNSRVKEVKHSEGKARGWRKRGCGVAGRVMARSTTTGTQQH